MNRLTSIGRRAAWIASLAMVMAPGLTAAAEPAIQRGAAPSAGSPSFRVVDVALDASGRLAGQAVSSQGQPLAKTTVALDNGREQWIATTDADGQFRFEGVQGGGYRVRAGQQVSFCRAWKAGTAPPAANQALMVVDGKQTILGQYCGSPIGCGSPVTAGFAGGREALRNPLVIGGIIAAAIAIPVALHNSGDDDPAS